MVKLKNDYWIQTRSGKKFSFLDPQPESITKMDIVIPLSRAPRYVGHTYDKYTVGQHSCHCAFQAFNPEDDVDLAKQAFAHDFAEAFTGDLPHPLKKLIRDLSDGMWTAIEDCITYCICRKYGIQWPFDSEVKTIDLRMLATERVWQLANPPEPWGVNPDPYDFEVVPWSEEKTKEVLLSWWDDLGLPND